MRRVWIFKYESLVQTLNLLFGVSCNWQIFPRLICHENVFLICQEQLFLLNNEIKSPDLFSSLLWSQDWNLYYLIFPPRFLDSVSCSQTEPHEAPQDVLGYHGHWKELSQQIHWLFFPALDHVLHVHIFTWQFS